MAKISKEDLDEIEHDRVMLSRVANYELTEKHMKFVRHLMEKAPKTNDNHYNLLKNYIQSLIGSAVMDYENKHVRGRYDIKTWFPE